MQVRNRRRWSVKKAKIAMLKDQEGQCALCRRIKPLVMDHDHHSGYVRALLCVSCNLGLGAFRDDPDLLRRASWYVRFFRLRMDEMDLIYGPDWWERLIANNETLS